MHENVCLHVYMRFYVQKIIEKIACDRANMLDGKLKERERDTEKERK